MVRDSASGMEEVERSWKSVVSILLKSRSDVRWGLGLGLGSVMLIVIAVTLILDIAIAIVVGVVLTCFVFAWDSCTGLTFACTVSPNNSEYI